MLNSKVYRACKNAQQRMIGMLDIGLPTPFYTNVTTELKGFVSAFIPNDRCDRLQAFYKKINDEEFDYLTDLAIADDIPEGWEDAMRCMFSHICDALIGLGLELTDDHYAENIKHYEDLTVPEWVCFALDCAESAMKYKMIENG